MISWAVHVISVGGIIDFDILQIILLFLASEYPYGAMKRLLTKLIKFSDNQGNCAIYDVRWTND